MELLDVATFPAIHCFCLVLLLSLLTWLKQVKKKKLNLPPSPPKLPIIGNIHQLGKLTHRSLRDLSRNYGSLLLLQLGYNPTILVSSAEMVREIVKNHDVVFCDRPKTTAMDILFYGCKGLAFGPYGEYWRQVKKMSVVELFSHQRVQSFRFVRDEEVEVLVNKIRRACREGVESIDLSEMIMSVSSNIVSQCVLGHKSDGCSRFGQLAKRILILVTSFCIGDMFPYLRWLDSVTGLIHRVKALSSEFDAFLDQVIEEHEEETNHKRDFVSIIMQLLKDGMFEMDLTRDNIKAILMDIFMAGTESSTTTTEWMMSELLKHPHVMKKVQQEVRDVVGNKCKVDMDDISKMEYLNCVLIETLRLHPPGVLVPRKTSATVKLGGYDIPSDTTVMINIWAIHRDPKWWENPEEFIPERFENISIDFKVEYFHFLPFGFGRRRCPGIPFGVASIESMMANLLYWFDWKLPAGETAENLDMNETFGFTVTKKIPLHVRPTSPLSL